MAIPNGCNTDFNCLANGLLLLKLEGTNTYVPLPSVQIAYGPYASMNDAQTGLIGAFDSMANVPQGYTFCVIENGKPQEYWLTETGNWASRQKKNSNSSSDDTSNIVFSVFDGYIQVSTDGGETWTKLISRASLQGDTGSPGHDGRDVDLNNLQLKFVNQAVEDPETHETTIQQSLWISRTGPTGTFTKVGDIIGGGGGSGDSVCIETYTDGYQYWSYGGYNWIYDDNGHMVRANGLDGQDGHDGEGYNTQFKSIVFKRQGKTEDDRPDTPTEGDYNNPVPVAEGWSDGVPATDALGNADAILWMSTRWFSTNEAINAANTWSTPQRATDTADMDFEYSNAPLNEIPNGPGPNSNINKYDPETNPNGWYDADEYPALLTNANWMAMRVAKNGYWGTWKVFKIRGESGQDGLVPVVSFMSTAFRRSDNYTISEVGTQKIYVLDPLENPMGGSYDRPNPTNEDGQGNLLWSDGVPQGTEKLWVTTRIFYSDDTLTSWRTPVPVGDTARMDFEWCDEEVLTYSHPTRQSPNDLDPQKEPDDPWYDEPDENADPVWMAMRPIEGEHYASTDWQVMRVKGERGDDGTSFVPRGQLFGIYNTANGLTTAQAYYQAHSSTVGTARFAIVGTGLTQLYEFSQAHPEGVDLTSLLTTGDAYSNALGGGMYNQDLYDLKEHIFIWDGDNFIDFGNIKGDPGMPIYFHIKYSNDGGHSFTFSGTVQDGETPGEWIGTRVDNNPQDSMNPDDYKPWKKWVGEDGFGYEYVFKLTNNDTPPQVPLDYPDYIKDGRTVTYQDDDYVPAGWTDDPGSPTKSNPYCWVIYRRKEHDVWQNFRGSSADSTRAALFSKWSSDGRGIEGVTEMYAVSDFETLTGMSEQQIADFKATFTESVPQFLPPNRIYLWNYEIIHYDDGTTQETEPEMIGMSISGRGIQSIEEFYYACNFGDPTTEHLENYLPQWTPTPSSSWELKPMNVSKDNPYLWNFERVNYDNGTSFCTRPIVIAWYTFTDIEYLLTIFKKVEGDSKRAYLGGLIGVIDENNIVKAVLNATDLGKDDEHGRLFIASGLNGISENTNANKQSIKDANFKVYEDGHVNMRSAEIQGYLTQYFRRSHDVERYLADTDQDSLTTFLDKSKLSNALLLGWNTLSFSEGGDTVDFSANYEVHLTSYLNDDKAGRVIFSNMFYVSKNGTLFANNNYGKTLLNGYFILPNGTITSNSDGVALYGGWIEAIKISCIDHDMELITPQLSSMDKLYQIIAWGGVVRFSQTQTLANTNENQAVVNNTSLGFNADLTRRSSVQVAPTTNIQRLTEFNRFVFINGDHECDTLYIVVPDFSVDTWFDQNRKVEYTFLLPDDHRRVEFKVETLGANTPDVEVVNLPSVSTVMLGDFIIAAANTGSIVSTPKVCIRLTYVPPIGSNIDKWVAEVVNMVQSV